MKKIFVGNLAWRASEDDLKKLFETYGEVLSVKIVTDQYTGKSKGFGFIEMGTPEAADAAIAGLDGQQYQERPLRVSKAQDRPAEGGGGGGGRGPGGGGGGFRRSSPQGERNYRGGGR